MEDNNRAKGKGNNHQSLSKSRLTIDVEEVVNSSVVIQEPQIIAETAQVQYQSNVESPKKPLEV